MSLTHRVVTGVLMKSRRFYDPAQPRDYAADRKRELALSSGVKLPQGVQLWQEALGGVPAEWVTGKNNADDRIVLYIHGGGFVTGSAAARRSFTLYLAHRLGLNTVSPDYRLAPEHPFPQAPDDCLAAYRALLLRYPAEKIVLLGESAGGNLVLSLLLRLKALSLPLPAGTFALSPAVQFDRELPSYRENLPIDCVVTNLSEEVRDVYLRSREESVLKNPLAAPLYGDYRGCTPVVLWVSDSEVLRDDSLLLFSRLKEQKVSTKLYIRSGMMHTWLTVPDFDESKKDLPVLVADILEVLYGSLHGEELPIHVG